MRIDHTTNHDTWNPAPVNPTPVPYGPQGPYPHPNVPPYEPYGPYWGPTHPQGPCPTCGRPATGPWPGPTSPGVFPPHY